MSRVRGTAVTNYVVVPHNPFKHALWRMVLGIAFLAIVYGAFWQGMQEGLGAEKDLMGERIRVQSELTQSINREAELRQKVAVLENGSFVDKQSVDGVRKNNRELSDQIAGLEEEIALYQGIMSPSLNAHGLNIQEVVLNKTASLNRYRFKVMLTQVGNNSNYLRGFVGINILGVQKGEVTAYPLKEVSAEIKDIDIKFRYRYFQDFTGELVLPEGFTPDQVQVVAQSVGSKSARVEKTFDWSDLENSNNVGQ